MGGSREQEDLCNEQNAMICIDSSSGEIWKENSIASSFVAATDSDLIYSFCDLFNDTVTLMASVQGEKYSPIKSFRYRRRSRRRRRVTATLLHNLRSIAYLVVD